MTERKDTGVLKLRLKKAGVNPEVCANCGSEEDIRIHHIVPLVRNGSNEAGNLVALCYECHLKAHDMRISKLQRSHSTGRKRVQEIEGYMSVKDISCKYNMGLRNIQQAIKNNRLNAIIVDGKYFIKENDFVLWQQFKWVKGWKMVENDEVQNSRLLPVQAYKMYAEMRS